MRRLSTPTFRVLVHGADLTGCDVYLTLKQGRKTITVKNPAIEIDGTDATLTVTLTQEQTATFMEGRGVEVQVNAVDYNGYRIPTNIITVQFGRNILEVPKYHG